MRMAAPFQGMKSRQRYAKTYISHDSYPTRKNHPKNAKRPVAIVLRGGLTTSLCGRYLGVR